MSPKKAARKPKSKSKSKAKPVKKAASKKAASASARRIAPKKAAKKKAPPRSGKVVEREERALGITTPRTSGSLGSSLSRARRSGRSRVEEAERDIELERITPRGMGSEAGGQSGSTQGLSEIADDDSESVEELEEEGQSFEAEVISGIEHADDDVEAGVPLRRRKRAAGAGEEALGDADEDFETGGES